jgi:SAM-dependent methyltransferase
VDAESFYDDLAGAYRLLFGEWWEAARWHGEVVAAVLAGEGVEPPASLLDCTCGIGTQALPLAALGFDVTGTDISPLMVDQARAEAASRGIDIAVTVADARTVADQLERQFDAVISCDNALAHLRTDEDLAMALSSIARCLRPGGTFLATIRDYDVLRSEAPSGVPMSVHGTIGSRHASGQAWTWSPDREVVTITLFTLEEAGDGWRGSSRETTCRALTRSVLTSALEGAGLDHVTWHGTGETGYYQPMVTATRRP